MQNPEANPRGYVSQGVIEPQASQYSQGKVFQNAIIKTNIPRYKALVIFHGGI
jgi:hypothetical protein